jgi:hypothetical protein
LKIEVWDKIIPYIEQVVKISTRSHIKKVRHCGLSEGARKKASQVPI